MRSGLLCGKGIPMTKTDGRDVAVSPEVGKGRRCVGQSLTTQVVCNTCGAFTYDHRLAGNRHRPADKDAGCTGTWVADMTPGPH